MFATYLGEWLRILCSCFYKINGGCLKLKLLGVRAMLSTRALHKV